MTFADLAGTTWIFMESIYLSAYGTGKYVIGSDSSAPIFSSNGINYQMLYLASSSSGLQYGESTNASDARTTVYKGGWQNVSYRTITFNDTLSNYTFVGITEESFINWMIQNAVRQGQEVYKVYEDQLKYVADAIRTLTKKTSPMTFPGAFVNAIEDYKPKVISVEKKTATISKNVPSYTQDYAYSQSFLITPWEANGIAYLAELKSVEYDGSAVPTDTFEASISEKYLKIICAEGKSFTTSGSKLISFTFDYYDIVVE